MASVARYRNLVPSVVRRGRREKNAGNEFNDAPIDAIRILAPQRSSIRTSI